MGNFDLNKLRVLQESLRNRVILKSRIKSLKTVAGADVSYSRKENRMVAVIVVMDFDTLEVIETAYHRGSPEFPYIPTFLSFRELPSIVKAFRRLKTIPDVIIVDGQGIAHPRRLGIATHLGLELDIPTIGCAKNRLVGEYKDPCNLKGCVEPLIYESEQVGWVVRTRDNVKPVFISPGHLVSLSDSLDIVMGTVRKFRLPEPIRMAHILSRARISVQP